MTPPNVPPGSAQADARPLRWFKVAEKDALPEGRVTTVQAGTKSICLTHHDGQYGALDNHCPHQGGPLGEGSIEDGLLRCPWHGWDYCPLTGASPAGFDERVPTYAIETRDDGIYVGLEQEVEEPRTVTDVMAETMVNWGVRHVFGMVGHSNLGLADALRRRTEAGELEYIAIRHEGAAAFAASAYGKLTGKPAACLTTGADPGLRPGRVPGSRPVRRLLGRGALQPHGAVDLEPRRADEPRAQARGARARRVAPDLPGRHADAAGRGRS
jgi:nitrite reductase/ring-hydroxylating ferredoxin subunit